MMKTVEIKVMPEDIENGLRRHSHLCPVARACKRALGRPSLYVGFRYISDDGMQESIPLPEAARDFI